MLQSLFCMIDDSTLLHSNESSPSTLPLRLLQEILHNRIIEKKRDMHPSHNKAYLESVYFAAVWIVSSPLTAMYNGIFSEEGGV